MRADSDADQPQRRTVPVQMHRCHRHHCDHHRMRHHQRRNNNNDHGVCAYRRRVGRSLLIWRCGCHWIGVQRHGQHQHRHRLRSNTDHVGTRETTKTQQFTESLTWLHQVRTRHRPNRRGPHHQGQIAAAGGSSCDIARNEAALQIHGGRGTNEKKTSQKQP